MRTTSGADVVILGEYALKVGVDSVGDRVGWQGRWLQDHPLPVLPTVMHSWDHGYVMCRLEPVRWNAVTDWCDLVERQVEALRVIWEQPAEVEPDVERHVDYVAELLEVELPGYGGALKPGGRDVMVSDWFTGELRDLPLCLTHGDPTFDNLMARPDGRLVLIDPLPARPEVPSYRAVDIAKICQSLHGYEHVKYGRPLPTVRPDDLRELVGDVSDEEWAAVEYFTAVHFLRLLRYETDLRSVFAQLFSDLAFGWALEGGTP